MKVGKHTLLIDGNYFIFSRLFVIPKTGKKPLLSDEESRSRFMRKLAIDFSSEVRKFKGYVDDIVVAVDDKSWRKDLYPEAQYKANRKHDDKVDWDTLYKLYGEFQDILSSHGVTVHKISGAEADDVLFAWSTALNGRGKSCIVWTGDRDLIQLVNYSSANDAHTVWFYNSKKVLYVYPGFIKDMQTSATETMSNDDMLFNMSGSHMVRDQYQANIMSWIKEQKVDVKEVNCDSFILEKILMGDKSDNIPSVVTWGKETKTGSVRIYSITQRLADKIIEEYLENVEDFKIDLIFSQSEMDRLSDIIYRVVGKSDPGLIKKNLDLNISLMLLHSKTIPHPILKAIFKRIEMDWEGAVDSMEDLMSLEKVLEDTKWITKGSSTPKSMDPFAGLDVPSEPKKTDERPKVKKLDELF